MKVESVSAINANVALNGTTVKPNESFNVVFNTELDEKTVTNENITIKKGSLAVPVTLTLSEDKKSVKVVPSQPLDVKSDFSLVVTTAVKTAKGEALAAEKTTTFKTADAVVMTTFKINNKTLEQGGFTALDLSTGITVVANKDLDRNTVNTSTVKLYNKTDSKFVPLTGVAYNSGTKTVTVTPLASGIENNKAYELRFDGVKALDGATADGYVQAFSLGNKVNATITVPKDYANGTTKVHSGLTGAVVKIGLTNNATADTDETLEAFRVTVNFNGRAIDTETLKPGTIKLIETDENAIEIPGTEVSGTITYDAATYSATFVPNSALKEKTNYKVSISKAIKDAIGLEVDEKYETFKTGDFTAPAAVTSNVDTGKRLGKKDALKVTFSEEMDSSRLNAIGASVTPNYTGTASVQVLDKDNESVAANVTLDPADTTGKTYSIIPTADWNVNETYTVKVNGKNYNQHLSATDKAGNPLATEYTTTFTTADTSIPSVTSIKVYGKDFTGAKANKELLGSTASNPVTGIEESGTVPQETIYIQFNRDVNDIASPASSSEFLLNASYEMSIDGGKTYSTLPATWTPTIQADEDGKDTIVKLVPDDNTIVSAETRYAVRLKKDTATADAKKLVDNVTVYFSTESAKPSLTSTSVFTDLASDADDTKAVIVSGTTKASELNNGIEMVFSESLSIKSINNTNIKIEDVTDSANPVALVGAFYEDITQTGTNFSKVLLSTTEGASTADGTIYWVPSSDDNKFVKGHDYKVTVSGVKDAVGNEIATPAVKYFTAQDTTAPTVTNVSVANGQQNVSVEPEFKVTFSKDVTKASAEAGITLTKVGGAAVTVDVTYDKDTKTATVKPLQFLDKLSQYTLSVNGNITDGNTAIGQTTNITFTTEDREIDAKISSAVWTKDANATGGTLTLTVNQPVKTGTLAITDIIVDGTALTAGGTNSIAISPDRKTIVVTETTKNLIPNINSVSVLQGGSIAPASGDYKEAIGVTTTAATAATGTVTYGTPVDVVAAVSAVAPVWKTGVITATADSKTETFIFNGVTISVTTGSVVAASANYAAKTASVSIANSATADNTAAAVKAAFDAYKASNGGVNELTGFTMSGDGATSTLITGTTAMGDTNNALEITGDMIIANTSAATQIDTNGTLGVTEITAVTATEITVAGTAITKTAAAGNGTTTFSTIAELTTAINAIATVDAVNNGDGTITVKASTAGIGGNSLVLTVAGDGNTAVSGSGTLSGGTAASTGTATQNSSNSIVIK